MVKTFTNGINAMISTTRLIAGILHPAGTVSARRAEMDLYLHLSEIRRRHEEADEAVARINQIPVLSPPTPLSAQANA